MPHHTRPIYHADDRLQLNGDSSSNVSKPGNGARYLNPKRVHVLRNFYIAETARDFSARQATLQLVTQFASVCPPQNNVVSSCEIQGKDCRHRTGQMEVSKPMSIAVIPDGARRWARRTNTDLAQAYRITFCALRELAIRLGTLPVSELHLYLLSKFNLARSDTDLIPCIREETKFVKNLEMQGMLAGVVGDVASVARRCPDAEELLTYSTRVRVADLSPSPAVWVYFGYSAEWHLADALHRLQSEKQVATASELAHAIVGETQLDLAIRTGGNKSLSDFLPLQLRYAQLEFLDDLFNDISIDQLLRLISHAELSRSNLRFGA